MEVSREGRHLPAGRLMKIEVSERWVGSRHAEMGKGNMANESNHVWRYRAQEAQGVNRERSSSSVGLSVDLQEGIEDPMAASIAPVPI